MNIWDVDGIAEFFLSEINAVLTSERSAGVSVFLFPLIISIKMIPKLYTSHFSVRCRSLDKYSGAVYPLQLTENMSIN